jgi:signal transduction histidine kinase
VGDSGVLTIRTSLAVSRKLLAVSFSDTGKGIPERYLAKVFEPYFTLKPGGTGLGMALTKRIIEDHKGTIVIQSKEGEGTTVTIALPAI